jgi:hypothetical protein
MIFGYTTRRHLLLDLDNKSLKQAIFITKSVTNTYDLGDALILISSQKEEDFGIRYIQNEVQLYHIRPYSFHVVFDKYKDWQYLQKVISTLAELGVVEESFNEVRTWRGDLTLRISPKLPKVPFSPVPVYYVYSSDNYHGRGNYGIMDYYMTLINYVDKFDNEDKKPVHIQYFRLLEFLKVKGLIDKKLKSKPMLKHLVEV